MKILNFTKTRGDGEVIRLQWFEVIIKYDYVDGFFDRIDYIFPLRLDKLLGGKALVRR